MSVSPPTYPQAARQQFTDEATRVAAALRRLADDVERQATPTRADHPVDGGPRCTPAASAILHTVTWGLANLSLERLATRANEADLAPYVDRDTEEKTR